MKTTKKLIKTLLVSLLMVSCLCANAMAEEGEPDGNVNIKLDLASTFTWVIPSEIIIEQGNLNDNGFYEQNFDISITSVTLDQNEVVEVVLEKEANKWNNGAEFKMLDEDTSNKNPITYYVREAEGTTNIAPNDVILTAGTSDFASNTAVTKTMKVVVKCDQALRNAGSYRSTLVFQANVVPKSLNLDNVQ